MTNVRKRLLGGVAAAAVLALSAMIPASVGAGPPKSYTAAATPATLALGSGQQTTVTLTNTTKNDIAFNAINLTVPTGLAVTNPTLSTYTGAGTVTLNPSTNNLELRDLNVGTTAPNNTVSVTVTITTSIQPTCQSYVWTSDVRQSNNFNGTLNKFYLSGPEPSVKAPCSSSSTTCTAGDQLTCSTGTIYSGSGSTASVTVQDSDTISGTLTAALTADAYQCDEYTSSSDQLAFGISVTNGASTNGLTKTVTFSSPVVDSRPAWQYQACFKAPYDFPAQLPSQLAQDFNTGDFTGNTQLDGTDRKGLLLPCSAGYGVPCIQSRTIASGKINITLSTSVNDPRLRV